MSEFESIAIITGDNGEPDEVWVTVLRYINSSWVRFIERFTSRDFNPDTLADAWFVDGGTQGTISTWDADIPEVLGEYPRLTATTDQADPGLTKTTAISNVTELQAMENNVNDNYYLTGDIDASATSGWNGGAGFDPVGTFYGTLDGCGYTITNLYINRPTENDVGLFSYAGVGSSIANLTLASCDITGKYDTGAIAGRFAGTLIQDCHVSGSVSGQYYVGGLIGRMTFGSVYDSDSSCTVLGLSGASMSGLGGLIGRGAIGTVSNCYSTGNVTGTTGHVDVGGFIGHSDGGATVSYCYATGDVTGNEAAGFVCVIDSAGASGSFQKCYATGNVYGIGAADALVAGFVRGVSTVNSSVTDCYSWGDCSSSAIDAQGAGFVAVAPNWFTFTNCYSIGRCDLDNPAAGATNPSGFAFNEGNATDCVDCFWDTETSGISVSDGGTGHTTVWLKTQSNYPVTWDFDNVWYMVDYVPAYTGNGLETTPIDYSHLEGETVNILADGIKYPQQTVTNGDIDDTEFANATTVTVGLPVKYIVQPMELNLNQLAHIPQKNLTHLIVKLYRSLSGRYGPDDSNLDPIIYSRTNFDSGPDLFSGTERLVFDGSWESAGDIWIEDNDPLPMTLGSIGVKLGYEND